MAILEMSGLSHDPVRFAGTPEALRMEEALARRLEALGLEVVRQPFRFLGWEAGSVNLVVETPEGPWQPAARAMMWSPDGSVQGVIVHRGIRRLIGVFDWDRFEVRGPGDDLLAVIVGRTDGPAIPLSLESPVYSYPTVLIGAEDAARLRSLAAGRPASGTLRVTCRYRPGSRSHNLIASVPSVASGGQPHDEVVVCAHHDTVYGSPGANDNGSGVEAVFRLARQLVDRPLRNTMVRFCLFGGEEWLQLGSRYYVQERQAAQGGQALSAVRLVVNLDMVGTGEFFWPWVDDRSERWVRQALERVAVPYEVRVVNPPYAGDHDPFMRENVPGVCLIWWPDPCYHLAADRDGHLDEEHVDLTVRVAREILRQATGA